MQGWEIHTEAAQPSWDEGKQGKKAGQACELEGCSLCQFLGDSAAATRADGRKFCIPVTFHAARTVSFPHQAAPGLLWAKPIRDGDGENQSCRKTLLSILVLAELSTHPDQSMLKVCSESWPRPSQGQEGKWPVFGSVRILT